MLHTVYIIIYYLIPNITKAHMCKNWYSKGKKGSSNVALFQFTWLPKSPIYTTQLMRESSSHINTHQCL